ncbi:hypothetical protein KP509_02G085700 [Ceratopteris richardii]|uniref:beta-N-acetylhexosaminidase n=1 Tax=Ceratopteris richardii TaxID=49495 RepID=A0A8T2VC06_CERRI|nr:hypothetical protein KP509_02G085700 [Ceratopteris richardii]
MKQGFRSTSMAMVKLSLLSKIVLMILLIFGYEKVSAGRAHYKSSQNLRQHGRPHDPAVKHGRENNSRHEGEHTGRRFPRIWPLPHRFTSGEVDEETGSRIYSTYTLAKDFCFDLHWAPGADVADIDNGEGSQTTLSPLLSEAFERYRALIFNKPSIFGTSLMKDSSKISSLDLLVKSPVETLRYGVDESYVLDIPDPQNASRALIQANTVIGALRGLETFSQLCIFDFETRTVNVPFAPWRISDEPRFHYRGLLIDTARHYQPLSVIKQVIDAMSYAKLNVLHWHIVDTQSFPLEIPSYPNLWRGSFSPLERYSMSDAKDIVEYARKRGIHVMPEIDVPGHAASWGVGYPQLWPSSNCTQPLDISSNFTFNVINGILSDFAKTFPFELVHMGGDEVNTSCWMQTPRIRKWLRRHNFTGFDGYKHFVLEAETISMSHGYIPVNWEEPFDLFNSSLNRKRVIHNWLQKGVAPKVVRAGFRCIVSNQDAWYLDHLDVPWQTFYQNEPWTNITDAVERALVLGGEVCMWGETVDASDIQQTIWPRAAAAAERLWSSLDGLAEDPEDVVPRLRHFRCLLNERGIPAASVLSSRGRDPPYGPGSCLSQ